MDTKQRAELIRERFKSKRPSTYLATPRRAQKPKIDQQPSRPGLCDGWFGSAGAWGWGKTEWVQEGDAKPSPAALRLKRNRDKSALAKIADNAPKKLRKRIAHAEALLTERANR